MTKFLFLVAAIFIGCNATSKMEVTSSGIIDGVIQDQFGVRGELNENGMPTYSLPVSIKNAPKGTVSYAIFLEDKDAFPVSGGFSWIHWVACNITTTEIAENISQTADFIQGANSWMSMQGGSQSRELSSYYGGMAPPDKEHIYELNVYALDIMLNLENGFNMNEMFRQMDGHILATAQIKGTYKN